MAKLRQGTVPHGQIMSKWAGRPFLLAFLSLIAGSLNAAQINIVNLDSVDEGLNDPTPRMPVGGNPGGTVGDQRLNALRFAANLVAQRISSSQIILVGTNFDPLNCESDNAELGAAGTSILVSDFPGAPRSDTFYPVALANALAAQDISPERDISATFNSALDDSSPATQPCLGGADWYYGLDNNPPPNTLDFISTATHELIHGLGFASFTVLEDDPATAQDESGQFLQDTQGTPVPDIFSVLIRDLDQGATWPQLTAEQRRASARNDGNLVWDGPTTTSQGAPTLTSGTNSGRVQLFAPATFLPGSSVSHWDVALSPNDLMEPFDTADNGVLQGIGLATCLLEDIGWQLLNNTRCPDGASQDGGTDGGGNDGGNEGGDGQDPVIGEAGDGSGGDTGAVISNSGGGGCVLAAASAPDPGLPLLLLAALAGLLRQWASRRWQGSKRCRA